MRSVKWLHRDWVLHQRLNGAHGRCLRGNRCVSEHLHEFTQQSWEEGSHNSFRVIDEIHWPAIAVIFYQTAGSELSNRQRIIHRVNMLIISTKNPFHWRGTDEKRPLIRLSFQQLTLMTLMLDTAPTVSGGIVRKVLRHQKNTHYC